MSTTPARMVRRWRLLGGIATGSVVVGLVAVVLATSDGGGAAGADATVVDAVPLADRAEDEGPTSGHAVIPSSGDGTASSTRDVGAEHLAIMQAVRVAEDRREEREEQRLAEQRAAEEEAAREAEAEAERRAEEEAARAAEEERRGLSEAQQRLADLGYYVGAADGQAGQQTTAAIMAFQAVNGLSVDGALGPRTWEALDEPRAQPSLRGGAPTRIEVDMDRQVLHLVEGDTRVTTMKASTGRGGTFESEAGETLRAETPVGTFTIDRRIAGEHQSSYGIGGMWDPMYFHGPWAIHGAPNVPAGPASAGCVRISMADGSWLFDRVPNGTPVVLYGGTHVFTP